MCAALFAGSTQPQYCGCTINKGSLKWQVIIRPIKFGWPGLNEKHQLLFRQNNTPVLSDILILIWVLFYPYFNDLILLMSFNPGIILTNGLDRWICLIDTNQMHVTLVIFVEYIIF